jgi:hypothetical protein
MASITIEQIERETEKALLIACEVETCAGRKGVKVWFPKSRVEVAGKELFLEEWLYNAKLADITGGRPVPGGIWFN